jgi:myo-inositol-1(or 4)-monophosphatase
VAAGIVIVKEAGGTITDLTGGDDYIFGAELLASNTVLHPLLLEAAMTHFRK